MGQSMGAGHDVFDDANDQRRSPADHGHHGTQQEDTFDDIAVTSPENFAAPTLSDGKIAGTELEPGTA